MIEIDRTLVDEFRSIDELINRMQQLCRQHGFHSKHLRLNQCYSVYYYHISCHPIVYFINQRPSWHYENHQYGKYKHQYDAFIRIINDVTSTRKNITRVRQLALTFIWHQKISFIFVLSLSNTCCVARIGHVVLKIGKMNQNHYRTSTPPKLAREAMKDGIPCEWVFERIWLGRVIFASDNARLCRRL